MKADVVVFSFTDCPWCVAAKKLLAEYDSVLDIDLEPLGTAGQYAAGGDSARDGPDVDAGGHVRGEAIGGYTDGRPGWCGFRARTVVRFFSSNCFGDRLHPPRPCDAFLLLGRWPKPYLEVGAARRPGALSLSFGPRAARAPLLVAHAGAATYRPRRRPLGGLRRRRRWRRDGRRPALFRGLRRRPLGTEASGGRSAEGRGRRRVREFRRAPRRPRSRRGCRRVRNSKRAAAPARAARKKISDARGLDAADASGASEDRGDRDAARLTAVAGRRCSASEPSSRTVTFSPPRWTAVTRPLRTERSGSLKRTRSPTAERRPRPSASPSSVPDSTTAWTAASAENPRRADRAACEQKKQTRSRPRCRGTGQNRPGTARGRAAPLLLQARLLEIPSSSATTERRRGP